METRVSCQILGGDFFNCLFGQVPYLISAINEATNVIPGWDDYVKSGNAKQKWDGVV